MELHYILLKINQYLFDTRRSLKKVIKEVKKVFKHDIKSIKRNKIILIVEHAKIDECSEKLIELSHKFSTSDENIPFDVYLVDEDGKIITKQSKLDSNSEDAHLLYCRDISYRGPRWCGSSGRDASFTGKAEYSDDKSKFFKK